MNLIDEKESKRRSDLIFVYRLIACIVVPIGIGGLVVFLSHPTSIRFGIAASVIVLGGIYCLAFPGQIADRRLRRVSAQSKRRNQDENHGSSRRG